jgi:predicted SnoaL-like aldol condensation-catalyzing enzyme
MTESTATEAPPATVAEFVDRFAAGWRDPSPEAFIPILHPEIRMIQPMMPELVGYDGLRRFLGGILGLIPDLRGEAARWGAHGDDLFVELHLKGTLGGRPIEWTVVDRFRLRDGKATERETYFDPAPLIRATLTRPRAWPAFVRSQVAARRAGAPAPR